MISARNAYELSCEHYQTVMDKEIDPVLEAINNQIEKGCTYLVWSEGLSVNQVKYIESKGYKVVRTSFKDTYISWECEPPFDPVVIKVSPEEECEETGYGILGTKWGNKEDHPYKLNKFNTGFLLGFTSGLVCYTIVYLILTFTI